jgi:hypothetical protein
VIDANTFAWLLIGGVLLVCAALAWLEKRSIR